MDLATIFKKLTSLALSGVKWKNRILIVFFSCNLQIRSFVRHTNLTILFHQRLIQGQRKSE